MRTVLVTIVGPPPLHQPDDGEEGGLRAAYLPRTAASGTGAGAAARRDLSLPADVPLAELLPTLVRLFIEPGPGDAGAPSRWTLAIAEGPSLRPDVSLGANGILNGALLQLHRPQPDPAPVAPLPVEPPPPAPIEWVGSVEPAALPASRTANRWLDTVAALAPPRDQPTAPPDPAAQPPNGWPRPAASMPALTAVGDEELEPVVPIVDGRWRRDATAATRAPATPAPATVERRPVPLWPAADTGPSAAGGIPAQPAGHAAASPPTGTVGGRGAARPNAAGWRSTGWNGNGTGTPPGEAASNGPVAWGGSAAWEGTGAAWEGTWHGAPATWDRAGGHASDPSTAGKNGHRAAEPGPLGRARRAWRSADYPRHLDAGIAAPRLRRGVTIAVISPKPGTGRTTMTALLAATLVELRPDQVRVVAGGHLAGGGRVRGGRPAAARHRSHATRFEQAAEPTSARLWGPFDDLADGDAAREAEAVALRGVVLVDCVAGLDASAARTAIGLADQLVLVTDADPATGSLAVEAALPLLEAGRSVTLVVNRRPLRGRRLDADRLHHMLPLAGGPVLLPHEPAAGAALDRGRLDLRDAPAGWRRAGRELAFILTSDWRARGYAR